MGARSRTKDGSGDGREGVERADLQRILAYNNDFKCVNGVLVSVQYDRGNVNLEDNCFLIRAISFQQTNGAGKC